MARARGQASARATRRARGDRERAIGAGVGLERSANALRRRLRSCGTDITALWSPAERSSGSPRPSKSACRARARRPRSRRRRSRRRREAGEARAIAEGGGPVAMPPLTAAREPLGDEHRAAAPDHGLSARLSQTASTRRPPGSSTRLVSAQRRLRVDHQHVAPATEHAVDSRRREVDPFTGHLLELDVLDAELPRAPRAAATIARAVGDQHFAAGATSSAASSPCRRCRGELEQFLAALRRQGIDHPGADGRRDAPSRPAGAPSRGGGLPAFETCVALGSGSLI